jgi:hypothetical protein
MESLRVSPTGREDWRFLAHFGAFWEGSVTDPQSQKQLITIGRNYVYHRRKRGQIVRGTEACDLPNRDGIDDRRTVAFRGVLATLKAHAERLGAADYTRLVPDERGRGHRRLWRVRSPELVSWRPRNHPLIVSKDAKGIKDCRAAASAIYANFPRSMGTSPLHREDSEKPRQQPESRDSS